MSDILIIGGADTGRAPMAAALLRRQVAQRQLTWEIGSAGVLGHDEDPPEAEARTAMMHMGIDISAHRARSASATLLTAATVLIAVDNGTAKAVLAQFPEAAPRLHSLGTLAGRQRDIPDPFRMQVGAWMTYAGELDQMLLAALPRLVELIQAAGVRSPQSGVRSQEDAVASRAAVLTQVERLLAVLVDMPEVIEWAAARARLDAAIGALAVPAGAGDLAAGYGGLLHAALALSLAPPSRGQAAALRTAVARCAQPISASDVTWLSGQLGGWSGL